MIKPRWERSTYSKHHYVNYMIGDWKAGYIGKTNIVSGVLLFHNVDNWKEFDTLDDAHKWVEEETATFIRSIQLDN